MDKTFKSILNDIKCRTVPTPVFTEEDLAKVKACLPEPIAIPPISINFNNPEQTTCINEGLDQIKKIVNNQLAKQGLVIELSTIKGKLQEALDHYTFISNYYRTRVEFFTSTIKKIEPFTSQHLYWTSEYYIIQILENKEYLSYSSDMTLSFNEITALNIAHSLSDSTFYLIKTNNYDISIFNQLIGAYGNILMNSPRFKSYFDYRIARIDAHNSAMVAKDGSTTSLAQTLQSIPSLGISTVVTGLITTALHQFSGQLIPVFTDLENVSTFGVVTPSRTLSFGIRLIDLDSTKITIPSITQDGTTTNIDKIINIRNSTYLKSKPFNNTLGTYCISVKYNDTVSVSPLIMANPINICNYDYLPGALYNMVPSGYPGYYKKLAHPIQYLYTLEERGLSIDVNQIDPLVKNVDNAPVSIKEGAITFYIKNQETYTKFYETLSKTLPDKLIKERDIIFPNEIKNAIQSLETIANQEVADFFRYTTDISIKLARPTSYTAGTSTIYSQGTFTYSVLDPVISQRLAYYEKTYSEISNKISTINTELTNLDKLISENSMNSDILAKEISNIPCFKEAAKEKAASPDCEAETRKKLGIDPLYIRTLSGTNSTLPDMNTPCYWKEFANCLNKISILPFPDIISPLFRYYPINNIISTPFGVILIPLPQKWTPLFSLSSPIGTIVTFITMPIAIVGIPLPSIYVLYISSDGNKYMLFAPNVPLLYTPPSAMKYGFEVDNSNESDNELGLNPSDPFKGHYAKGSLSIPLRTMAATAKSSRLTQIAAMLALGEPLTIKNGAGSVIGAIDNITYSSSYLSSSERAANGADFDPGKDFDRQITEFKRNISKQFDRLGDMQLTSVTNQKEKTRNSRNAGVMEAENEPNLKRKRALKKAARQLDPVNLHDKITSILSDFEKYIDKINLGNIYFPDDPTKLNPKPSPIITGLQSIAQQASQGGLAKDKDSNNLLAKIKRIAAKIDPDTISKQKTFNLRKTKDVIAFKAALKNYANEAIEYLQGNKSESDIVDPNLSDTEKAKIKKAATLRKARLKTALAFTALTVTTPNLQLFDPSAPCCSSDVGKLNYPISPQVLAAIAVFIALFDAFLDGLTPEVLQQLLGDSITNIGLSTITTLFDTILSAFPPITLPDKADLISISQIVMAPVLALLAIPQAPNPLGLPFPIQISIPLDAIVKPLLKVAIGYLLELLLRMLAEEVSTLVMSKSSDQYKTILRQVPCGDSQIAIISTTSTSEYVNVTLPNGIAIKLPKTAIIPLDIITYFALLTSTDLRALIKNLIMAAVEGILQPVKTVIVPILNLTKSLKDLSFNIVEAGNPLLLPLKLISMLVQLQIPSSQKIRIANLKALELLTAAYIPVITAAEPVVKEIAYLGTIAACAFGNKPGVQAARTAGSPFFNQDDLPPWERLTHKNPLFAIFLDEIAWRSSLTSTGSLLFRTKMPGLFPAGWTPTINNDIGMH